MKVFWITIAGTLTAAVGFEFGDSLPYNLGAVVGLLGTALTIAGAWLQYRQPARHELSFEASHWQPGGDDGYELHVPAIKHGRGFGSSVEVYQQVSTGYESVTCSVRHTSLGGVVVGCCKPFSGKVVII